MPFTLTDAALDHQLDPAALDHSRSLRPIAVVDIGSNSVRLVVYEGALRSPTPIFNEKIQCGLGKSLASTGMMGVEPVDRAVSALSRFHAITRMLNVQLVKAVATAAVREAGDGAAFLLRGEAALGCKIEVLSGVREAELAARGIIMGFQDPDGIAGDLGGGSLELINIQKSALTQASTLPLGILRLSEASNGSIRSAATLARKEVAKLGWLARQKPKRFFAVGGSWRALAKLHMRQTNYPLQVMHHYTIPADAALEFFQKVRRDVKPLALDGIDAVGRTRRESLPMAAAVLEQTLLVVQPEEVVFSAFGIREGLIYEMLSEAQRSRDPLIEFCEAYADLRARGGRAAGYQLYDWMTPLMAGLKREETELERRTRLAACLMSDIGWRAHPDYRGEQNLNVVAHSGMTGIDHLSRIFISLCLYFRHRGASPLVDALSQRLVAASGEEQLVRVRVIAAAMRTAHLLSCGTAGVLPETQLICDRSVVRLNLPREFASLDGERVRRRLQTIAQLVGREAEVNVERVK